MSAKRKVTFWVILFAAVLAGCAISAAMRGGPPGGPIIVIQPNPEEVSMALDVATAQVHQCKAGEYPCWYLGSFDDDHFQHLPDLVTGVDEDPPKLPHYLHNNAEVYRMEVRLKNDPTKFIDISMVTLKLASGGVLEIDAPTLPQVPVWKYGPTAGSVADLPNKRHAGRDKLSKVLIGKFTAVDYKERTSGTVQSDVDPKTIHQIRIYYVQ